MGRVRNTLTRPDMFRGEGEPSLYIDWDVDRATRASNSLTNEDERGYAICGAAVDDVRAAEVAHRQLVLAENRLAVGTTVPNLKQAY